MYELELLELESLELVLSMVITSIACLAVLASDGSSRSLADSTSVELDSSFLPSHLN